MRLSWLQCADEHREAPGVAELDEEQAGLPSPDLSCMGCLPAQCLTQQEAHKGHKSQKEVHLQVGGMGVVPLKAP